MRSLIADARALIETDKPATLPLAVTYYVGGQAVPAKVTRLLKKYFELAISAYTSSAGNKVGAETKQFDYGGESKGSHRRVSKDYERRYGVSSSPSIGHDDLVKVRVLSGRSPG